MAARTVKVKFDGDSTGLKSATNGASATLERFEKTTEDTRKGMDRVGEGSENLADSSSLATGALGALASGFELVGLEGYSERLMQASLATDFMSGVGDSLTLVTQKLGLATAKAKVQTVAHTVATKAQTVALKASAIAQRALNLVMRANPIGIVITAIAGLIAIIVIAYKRSEKFRKIVNAAFNAVKKAAMAVWNWIKNNFPKIFHFLTTPHRLALRVVLGIFDKIRSGAGRAKEGIVNVWNSVVDFFRRMPGRIANVASGMWNSVYDAFKNALNAIIRTWNDFSVTIDIPDAIPGLPDDWTLSTPNIGMLARGGYAAPGRSYIVGENGPELLTMGGRGFVTPNGQLGGSTEVRVFIGDQELRGLVRTEISEGNRHTKRRALAGTGAAR